jgi:probable F420-dependent oxidoreductase
MFVSIGLPVDRTPADLLTGEGIGACAEAAERHGIDAVFVTDHPAPDETWIRRGGHPTVDPFVALSFAAAATTRLRLHTNLLVLGYRNPFLAAKAVASLDVLSSGRVTLGVGVGYLEAEFDALGGDYGQRAAVADDALEAMKHAWSGEPVHRDGRSYRAAGTVVRPSPAQQPHPPIWVGGNSVAAMRRVVRHGQGWSPMPSPRSAAPHLGTPGIEGVDELATRIRRLHQMMEDAGRTDPVDIAVIPRTMAGFASGGKGAGSWSSESVLDEIGQLRRAGGTALVANLPGVELPAYLEALERLATEVVQKI